MKISLVAALGFASVFVGGCTTTVTEQNSSKLKTGDLCFAAAVSRAGNSGPSNQVNALKELQRRGALTPKEAAQMMSNTQVQVGMTERAAVCMWGGMYNAVNVTETARGTRKQYVSYSDYRPTHYFYTENGIVTAVQY